MLGINLKETSSAVIAWASSHNLSYPIVIDSDYSVWNQYGMGYIPHNVIIDTDMVVRYTNYGYEENYLIQTLEPLLPNPEILVVKDVPYDQGGRVTIEWQASTLDTNINMMPFYSIWRALPDSSQPPDCTIAPIDINQCFVGTFVRRKDFKGQYFFWEWLGNQPAHRFPAYAYTAPTLYDSMSTTLAYHVFMVSAHTSDPNIYYDSAPVMGYSVDNLSPAPPQNLVGVYDSSKVILHWNANPDPDILCYFIYRCDHPNVNRTEAIPIAAVHDTMFVDDAPPSANTLIYFVIAQDIHENFSSKSNEVTISTSYIHNTDISPARSYYLSQNYPNPFNPKTTIPFFLKDKGFVTLKIFNLRGKEIETLIAEEMMGGEHSVDWFPGNNLSSGIYIYRLYVIDKSSSLDSIYSEEKKLVLMK